MFKFEKAHWKENMKYANIWLNKNHYNAVTESDGASNHQPHKCLLSRLPGRRSKKTSKLCITGLCAENSPVTGEFPAQRASNAENVAIWWRHHINLRSWNACVWFVLKYFVSYCEITVWFLSQNANAIENETCYEVRGMQNLSAFVEGASRICHCRVLTCMSRILRLWFIHKHFELCEYSGI